MKRRIRILIRGAVQGVGFRPFVYKLATELGLSGWVLNSAQGVSVEAEGERQKLDEFFLRIEKEKPPLCSIQSFEASFLDPKDYYGFEIRESADGKKTALILPDIATCPDCRQEILDPKNRRYQYPFTNCTNCGPRYTIVEKLPYDRENTTMKQFIMCDACQAEYNDPKNRRFHAQPNACPQCGPHLEAWDEIGKTLFSHNDALEKAIEVVKEGKILALKGLGGFHLIVDARNAKAVKRLRERKHREAKPFALMYSCIEDIKKDCEVSLFEERLLLSAEAPIVLLSRKGETCIADEVAPRDPYYGVMLAYTPLHILLLKKLGFPVVATSGNICEETICTDEIEALASLKNIADIFLVHNRSIKRHMDDSIVRMIRNREMVLRRARGFAPLPIAGNVDDAILATGTHMKNTVAISVDDNIFVSQHIGDLETAKAFLTFERTIQDLEQLYEIKPKIVACDIHPDYYSTQYAKKTGLPAVYVQHHYAHILSCMAENEIDKEALGVAWDGTGYGLDSTLWGGEFLKVNFDSFERVGFFEPFPLPGGEAAIKEPRRSAIGLLYQLLGDKCFEFKECEPFKTFSDKEIVNLKIMLNKNIQCPMTSSIGRIFDAVSSLTGFCQVMEFEGQAAMELEFAAQKEKTDQVYSFSIQKGVHLVVQCKFMMEIIEDLFKGLPKTLIAAKFHNTLADIVVAVATRCGIKRVMLSGGCFQNKYLLEKVIEKLEQKDFLPYWHQRIPPNDGGVSLGQVMAGQRELKRKK